MWVIFPLRIHTANLKLKTAPHTHASAYNGNNLAQLSIVVRTDASWRDELCKTKRQIHTHFKYSAVIWPCHASRNENASKKLKFVPSQHTQTPDYFALKKNEHDIKACAAGVVVTGTADRDSSRYRCSGNRRTRQLASAGLRRQLS